MRLLGRYLNFGTEEERLRDLCKRASSEQVARAPVSNQPARTSFSKLKPAQCDEILRRYRAGDRPVDIARDFGVTEWTIQNVRKRAGVATRGRSMSRDEIDRAAQLKMAGTSLRKIATAVRRRLYLRRRHVDAGRRKIGPHESGATEGNLKPRDVGLECLARWFLQAIDPGVFFTVCPCIPRLDVPRPRRPTAKHLDQHVCLTDFKLRDGGDADTGQLSDNVELRVGKVARAPRRDGSARARWSARGDPSRLPPSVPLRSYRSSG